ncbi:hypothetical protein E4T48_05640 [Aureobasidium sp. EXF-10727]|nr:hypothetical protein E4T48_05640 [Aureobasidium sp. EXF-10727]
MSALWYREARDIDYVLNATTPLVLREAPNKQDATLNGGSYLLSSNQTRNLFISDLYDISLQNWLYGATIEITQSAVMPAWTKDVWSFLPRGYLKSEDSAMLTHIPETYSADPSLWLTKIDLQNWLRDNKTGNSLWNKTNSPSGLDYGYILRNVTEATFNMEWSDCCANQTFQGAGSATVGYWSNANGPILTSTWIDGYPVEGHYTPYYTEDNNLISPPEATKNPVSIVGPLKPELFVWQEPPRMAAISCEPRIEEAEATITVEIDTGLIRDYEITGTLRNPTGAWTYPYTQENLTTTKFIWQSDDDDKQEYQEAFTRVNASWGYIFRDALMNSGQQDDWFRFQERGLNVDLMSYSMLSLVNNDEEALRSPNTRMDTADRTFAIFFKHFACFNVTESKGGYVFVPKDFNSQDSPDLANATLSTPVEELRMSPAAAILSMSILVFLIIITTIMYTANRKEYKAIPRDVSTLASILGWVYASDRLLSWSEQAPPSQPWYRALFSRPSTFAAHQRAKMGPFTDSRGMKRWGIELVDDDTTKNTQVSEENDARYGAITAGEWLELSEPRRPSAIDNRDDGDLSAREKLLQASDTENETVGVAKECRNVSESEPEPGPDDRLKGLQGRRRKFSDSDTRSSLAQA